MMKLLLLFFIPQLLFAAIPGIEIKDILEKDLKTNYLSKLEARWGDCGASPESCLTQKDDYQYLSLPKKESCFPYTQCGFYHCMEEKYQCENVGVNYFTKLAYPTCSAYVKILTTGFFLKRVSSGFTR